MPFPDPPVTARDFARIACTCMDCDIGNSCSFADSGEDAVKDALRALREGLPALDPDREPGQTVKLTGVVALIDEMLRDD
jgi:hypothetical protein